MMRAALLALFLTLVQVPARGAPVPAPAPEGEANEIEAAIASLRARAEKLAKLEANRDEAEKELARIEAKKDEIEKELRFMNRRPVVHNNDMNKKEKEREALVDTDIPAAEAKLAKAEKGVERQKEEVDEAMVKIESFGEAAVGPIEAALADRKKNGEIAPYLHELLARLEPEEPDPRDDRRAPRPRR